MTAPPRGIPVDTVADHEPPSPLKLVSLIARYSSPEGPSKVCDWPTLNGAPLPTFAIRDQQARPVASDDVVLVPQLAQGVPLGPPLAPIPVMLPVALTL